MLGLNRCADPVVMGYPVAWFSPTYKMLIETWREAVRTFAPITARRSVQERRIEYITGGMLEFWSLDNPDVARGRKYRRVVIDEAAMVPNLLDIWQYAIRPTLADYNGDAWFLSTPKGRNGFWQFWQWGRDGDHPDWRAWQLPSSVNPRLAQSELDEMQASMPERVHRQEILAAFIEDGGGVFRYIREAAKATRQEAALPNHSYIMGVDLARRMDFTVIVVLDTSLNPPEVVFMDRFNQVDWQIQVGRIRAIAKRFQVDQVIVDQTGVGDPIVEQLQRELY